MMKSDLSALRVLVVDDVEFMRTVIVQMLHEMGIRNVRTAGTGAEAWDLISREGPIFDLVLSDVMMPIMDGIELLAHVRKSSDPALATTPFVMLTAHAYKEHVTAAAQFGVRQFVAKPVSIDVLESRIRAAIAPKESHRPKPE